MTSIKAKLTAVLASVALAVSLSVPAFAYEQVEDVVSYGHGYNDAGSLVIHETANPGASAYNHTLLWSRDDTYAVHYVMELDGSVVYHTVPDWALCWHVGNGNYATVGIELAHATNWEDFNAQWDQAVAWAGDYLNSRGWGIDRLLSHNDCTWIWGGSDHTDPTGGWWLPEMVDHTDTGGSGDTFAGNGYDPIRWLTIDMPGWYQVCTEASGWLDPVYGYDKGDLMWGCAGDGSPITAVRCYYETQDPNRTGWLVAEYNVNGLANMHDLTDTGGSWDDFAGNGSRVTTFSLMAA